MPTTMPSERGDKMALKWKKRCFRCLQYLRDDGTCQNPKCVRYVDESSAEKETKTDEAAASANVASTAAEDKA